MTTVMLAASAVVLAVGSTSIRDGHRSTVRMVGACVVASVVLDQPGSTISVTLRCRPRLSDGRRARVFRSRAGSFGGDIMR